jgi:hypothetical protein
MKQNCFPDEVPPTRLLHRLQSDLCITEIQIQIEESNNQREKSMKRLSSQLIVFGLIVALSAATSVSLQAAEAAYQGVQYLGPPQNVALAANGAVAAASSTGFGDTEFSSASKLIDDTRSGIDCYWTDDTIDEFPDVVQINFFGSKTIDRVVVYSVQEELKNFGGIDPTDSDNCYVYVLADFTVQGWNGNDWATLATVSGNDLCKRTVTFAPISTDQIRINVTATGGWSLTRIAEVEAWEAQ